MTTGPTYLFNLPEIEKGENNPQLLRVIVSREYTRIDFGYQAEPMYSKGGWVVLSPHTYLIESGKSKKYSLKEAVNIPIEPQYHFFDTRKDWKFFSIYFEPLPAKDLDFDLIEADETHKIPSPVKNSDEQHAFNYYGICLRMKNAIRMTSLD